MPISLPELVQSVLELVRRRSFHNTLKSLLQRDGRGKRVEVRKGWERGERVGKGPAPPSIFWPRTALATCIGVARIEAGAA